MYVLLLVGRKRYLTPSIRRFFSQYEIISIHDELPATPSFLLAHNIVVFRENENSRLHMMRLKMNVNPREYYHITHEIMKKCKVLFSYGRSLLVLDEKNVIEGIYGSRLVEKRLVNNKIESIVMSPVQPLSSEHTKLFLSKAPLVRHCKKFDSNIVDLLY